ncbi:hypothetical protein E2C01_083476 [Portunus trituberculatus]|uniref:Uncharacterized protein n=1 Tax=Portunus trituberculatus TaxID=210409 RepID=A0A5B7J3L2_PORTR|nr:hypothetical protein [Portunus trituberculatus]
MPGYKSEPCFEFRLTVGAQFIPLSSFFCSSEEESHTIHHNTHNLYLHLPRLSHIDIRFTPNAMTPLTLLLVCRTGRSKTGLQPSQ